MPRVNYAFLCLILFAMILAGSQFLRSSEPTSTNSRMMDIVTTIRHEFSRDREFTVVEFDGKLQAWRKSLMDNLHYAGPVHTFLQTTLPLHVDGVPTQGLVYQCLENPNLFHIDNHEQISVDFERMTFGLSGGGGISFHPHANGKMIVCLNPTNIPLVCVPLTDTSKNCKDAHPKMSETAVSWDW